jgi:hypothetical protein
MGILSGKRDERAAARESASGGENEPPARKKGVEMTASRWLCDVCSSCWFRAASSSS